MNATQTMTEAQFLEELAGLKDRYWWYLNHADCIRGELHDTVSTSRVYCPITALHKARNDCSRSVTCAMELGPVLGMDEELTPMVIDASDEANDHDGDDDEDYGTRRFRLRAAMLKALGLKPKDRTFANDPDVIAELERRAQAL